ARCPGGASPRGWLPDGRIVFAHYRGSEPLPRWYLIRPDGTRLRSLPHLYGVGDPLDPLRRPHGGAGGRAAPAAPVPARARRPAPPLAPAPLRRGRPARLARAPLGRLVRILVARELN